MATIARSRMHTSMSKIGFTLGKFAPLHKGHQRVLHLAEAEMDKVIALIYDAPEQTSIPLSKRADWIRQLHPSVEVIEGVNGPTVTGRSLEVMRIQEDYVKRMLQGRSITHFYSSEFYGEHMSRALGALDRRVDCSRTTVPISASRIRQAPFAYRHFVDPFVYRDLIVNVALLGAPSTGKTTLAQALAEHFNTQWLPEYGREYWELHQVDRRLTAQQLVEIAHGHLEREEEALLASDRFLFTDTNVLTTAIFAKYYHGDVHPELARLADASASRYDLIVLCSDDIPYDGTWDRSGEGSRSVMQAMITDDLHQRGIAYHVASGDLHTRISQVASLLQVRWKLMP